MKVASSQSLKPIPNTAKNTSLGKGTGTGGKGIRKHLIIAAGNKKELQPSPRNSANQNKQVVNIQMLERITLNGSVNPLEVTNLNSTGTNQNPFLPVNNTNDS